MASPVMQGAISALHGILRARVSRSVANGLDNTWILGVHCSGYAQCLDDLIDLAKPKIPPENVEMTFGAKEPTADYE